MTRRLAAAALLAALAACSGGTGGADGRPARAKTGLPAPEINLPKLLNAPAAELRGWDALRGKAVVLEFWATWCEPCVDYQPELNSLAERFRGKPVVFLHVTDESEADVRAFLDTHHIDGWVAPEAGADVFKAFKVYGRPHTVLIDRGGKVAAFPRRGELTVESLMGLLAGQYLPAETAPPLSTGTAIAEFRISRSSGYAGAARYGPASLDASAMPLEYALEWVYGRVDRFDVKPSAAAELAASYDIRMHLPPARESEKREFFLKGLETSLGLRVSLTEREEEVYALAKAAGGPVNVKPRGAYGGVELQGSAIEARGATFGALAARLKETLRVPVLDETRDDGFYEYVFELDTTDPAAADARLRERLGLSLSRVRRRINVVQISKPSGK